MRVSVYDVLKSMYGPNETVYFCIVDEKGGEIKEVTLSCECGKYMSIEPDLKKYNAMNRGIYFMVNPSETDNRSITRINAQFVEIDNDSYVKQKEKIFAFPTSPSMIIKTQKSYNIYWLVDSNAKVDCFHEIQERLAEHFNGKLMCVNEENFARLPGYMCFEGDLPVEVTCVSFHPEHKYTQKQLTDALPGVDVAPEYKSGIEMGIKQVMRSCTFLQHCRDDAASLSEYDWYAMLTNLALFDNGAQMIHSLSATYPGYNAVNTQKKINYFLENEKSPITCEDICQKGFSCPQYETGKCPVKAPAEWCYQPMSVEDLRNVLRGLPYTRDGITDMKTAKQYIMDYLYNQDELTAKMIINSEIRGYFNIQSSFLKSLNSVYRNVSKAYQARSEKVDKGIPDWYEVSDKGLSFLPGVLAKQMAEEQKVFYSAEQHYCYQNGVYRKITEMQAQHMVQEKMLVHETKMSQIKDAEQQWRLQIQKDVRELNANPYIINIHNGLYNVLEDTLMEHTPDYYSTVQLNLNYDKKADCPLFKKYLAESMDGDMDQVQLIQEILGYFLIPVNSAQKCFLIVGVAGSGKSVLLRVLNEILLGRENVSNVAWQDLNQRFMTAELFGKLANIFADLPSKRIDDNGIFKALVGEDYLTVERKNKNPFSFQSTARLLFSCNSLPQNFGDHSEGFYRRLLIIPFNHAVPADKRDPELIKKFSGEADGIFQFALEGLRRLINNDNKFSVTQVNEVELQRYREESCAADSVLSFVNDCCELGDSYVTGSTELFDYYVKYCGKRGIRNGSQKYFVGHIRKLFPKVVKDCDNVAKRRTLNGIRLVEMTE